MPAARDRPTEEAGVPASGKALRIGDVVTLVNEDGQKVRFTVADIEKQAAASESATADTETNAEENQSTRSAGSDHIAVPTSTIRPSEERFRKLSTEFAVPDSPAAHVLNVASEQVIHAKTPKQLVTALINGLDQNGNLQNGFALDFAPMQIYLGRDRQRSNESDLEVYARGAKGIFSGSGNGITEYFMRVLGRTQLSIASVRGTSDDDKSAKAALGLHTTFIDANDRALLAGLTEVDGPIFDSLNGPTLDQLTSASVPEARFDDSGLLGKVANFLWDHASWSAGAAPSWIAEDGDSQDYRWNGLTAWSTFTLSLKPQGNRPIWPLDFLLHVRYRADEQIPIADALALSPGGLPDPAEMFVNQDSVLAVAGLRFGRKDFFVTGTATSTHLRQARRGSDNTFRYTIALEKKISSATWLSLSVGTETSENDEEKPLLVMAGVKLGLDGESFSEH